MTEPVTLGVLLGLVVGAVAVAVMHVLPFGRKQESEADVIGLEYMAKAGYDPRASIHLWKNMSSARQERTPEFLSTHPSYEERIVAAQIESPKLRGGDLPELPQRLACH